MKIHPFANESDALSLGGITIENHTDRIAVFGDATVSRDKAGLRLAKDLAEVINAVVSSLEADKMLPDAIAPDQAPTGKRDPFAG
ncbi:hypothetical protein [Bordetella sp. FB-8]|uniref:hypothetical protein n=1 Tax=Bordetella sp. FB-8 TaxID=1159870 RepID=UPI0003761EB8|nr:hypothetical protein [Bordetella sp. FB-8]